MDLLGHRSVKRLGAIRQLGFSRYRQQTRLQHTLASVELILGILEKVPDVGDDLRDHVLAAIILEDIGRAPFSNSLDAVFTSLPGMDVNKGPIDVQRSILVIRYLEEHEHLLSHHSLSCDLVCGLLEGSVPWRGGGWLRSLLDGTIDIDRLAYVRGDKEYAEGKQYNTTDLIRGRVVDPSNSQTIVDETSIDSVVEFLLERARLYIEVYYDSTKVAMEHVVRLFLEKLWSYVNGADDRWQDIREPKSVEEFLSWNDETVTGAFEGERWDSAPADIKGMRDLIRENQLEVAEVQESDRKLIDLEVINSLLAPVKAELEAREYCWVLDGNRLPVIRVYQAGTVIVKQKGSFSPLEKRAGAVQTLTKTARHCPLLLFRNSDFIGVQSVLEKAGLVLSRLRMLRWVKGGAT